MNLLTLSLCAPLIGVDEALPNILHAVTMESVVHGWGDGNDPHFVSACGIEGLKLLGRDEYAAEWPPRVSTLGARKRCVTCHVLTGRMRPRSEFKRVEVST